MMVGKASKLRSIRSNKLQFERLEDRKLLASLSQVAIAYDNSVFDSYTPGDDANNSQTLDTSKAAFSPGQTATFANYSSYAKGINSIAADVDGLTEPTQIDSSDFLFYVGSGNSAVDMFPLLNVEASVSVKQGEGINGTDRVWFFFPDHSIINTYLQVTILDNDRTGFDEATTFYVGNVIAETGNSPANALVNLIDLASVRNNFSGFGAVGIESDHDFDRDGRVDLVDLAMVRENFSGFSPIPLINAPDGPTTSNAWTELSDELQTVVSDLIAKMNEAELASISTSYAQVTLEVLNRFTIFTQYDRDNPSHISDAVDAAWWNSIVPDNYHLNLPIDEILDSIEIGKNAIQELQDQLDGVLTLETPVDFSIGTYTQGLEYWLLDGEPVFPSGLNFYPDATETLEAFGRKGGWYYPLAELHENGTLPQWAIDGDVESISNDLGNNRAPLVSFFGSRLANWMTTNHPEVEDGQRHFIKWDTDSPLIRQWFEEYIENSFPNVIPSAGDTPRVHLLANEPHFSIREGGWKATNGISQIMRENYRSWLLDKYNDLATLNTTYGTSFADFDQARDELQVPMPLSLQGGPIWYDFNRFNMERRNEYFTFLADVIQQYDPGAPTTIKLLGGSLSDPYRASGIDVEHLAKLQGVLGSDFKTTPATLTTFNNATYAWQDRYALEWRQQTMGLDFFKSIAPDKPFFDSEWHAFDGQWKDFQLDPAYVRSALWLGFTHGFSAVEAWVWGRDNDGSSNNRTVFVGELTTQPKALDAFGRTIKEVNAHAATITSLVPKDRPFSIYYVDDSAIQDTAYMTDVEAVYESIKMLNHSVGFTTPTEIANLSSDHTIIVPRTPFISAAKLAALENFAGNIILVEPNSTFLMDEHGKTLDPHNIDPLATVDLDDAFVMADSFEIVLDPLVDSPDIEIEIEDSNSLAAYGVIVNQAKNETTGDINFSLINVSTEPRQARIILPAGAMEIVDLITGNPVTDLVITLQPFDVRLLRAIAAESNFIADSYHETGNPTGSSEKLHDVFSNPLENETDQAKVAPAPASDPIAISEVAQNPTATPIVESNQISDVFIRRAITAEDRGTLATERHDSAKLTQVALRLFDGNLPTAIESATPLPTFSAELESVSARDPLVFPMSSSTFPSIFEGIPQQAEFYSTAATGVQNVASLNDAWFGSSFFLAHRLFVSPLYLLADDESIRRSTDLDNIFSHLETELPTHPMLATLQNSIAPSASKIEDQLKPGSTGQEIS